MIYDRIFVHAGEMAKIGNEYEFLAEDRHGFLHGEIRIEAIKILRRQGRVREIIAVGGRTEDGMSKVKLMAERIGGEVTQLESIRSTRGNVMAIKGYLNGVGGKNGLLTNFYHLPRAMRLVAERGLNLVPVCAEAVLLTDGPQWLEKIKDWYSQSSMLTRMVAEIEGLSDIEAEHYIDYLSKYG